MDLGDEHAAAGGATGGAGSHAEDEPHVSAVPGCILLAIGALMVLLLAIGWLI